MRRLLAASAGILVLLAAGGSVAQYGVSPTASWAEIPTSSAIISLMSLPDTQGRALSEAYLEGGVTVDATIHAYIRDNSDYPIPGIPPDEIFLAVIQGANGVQSCRDEHLGSGFYVLAHADERTDGDGHTTFSLPLRAGGWDSNHRFTNIVVAVDGWGILIPVNLIFNSPDMSGNGVVDLSDAVAFATVFLGEYHYSADFNFDQTVDLADLVLLAGCYGARCP